MKVVAQIEQDVQPEIVEKIADDFANWIDARGYEIRWHGQGEESQWDYSSLARDYRDSFGEPEGRSSIQ